MRSLFLIVVLALTVLAGPLTAQEAVSFDDVPAGIVFEGASPIRLNGDVAAMGEVSTTVGVRFPDGSLQETASGDSAVAQSASANAGLYSNKIVDMIPPQPYTEIRFKGGAVLVDIHSGNETTVGGNCVPGDTGWILERLERADGATSFWTTARATCLMARMRLPEPFEWQYACDNAALFGVSALTDDWEWASNSVSPQFAGEGYSAVPIFGSGGCARSTFGPLGTSSGLRTSYVYRCAR